MFRKLFLCSLICSFLMLPAAALADSIDPASFSGTLGVGESETVRKTVTITEEVTSAKVDVFFLTDSTGSMGGLINSVKAAAADILTDTAGLGDVAFGVGEYRDFGDAFVYRTNTALTTNQAAAAAGISMWFAGGGGDFEEANLFALEEVATTTAWRADSTRILVWFGDAPGHDPSGGVTEGAATASLLAEGIVVEALDMNNLDLTGQATRITTATGGSLFSGIDPGNIADVKDAIADAIADVFEEYNTVSLGVIGGDSGGVDVSIAPLAILGTFDRSTDRTFEFDVTFTGVDPGGPYEFEIGAFVDGGLVAIEDDSISVRAVPEPATLLLLIPGLLGLVALGRRKKE